jgi:hypothetical protein
MTVIVEDGAGSGAKLGIESTSKAARTLPYNAAGDYVGKKSTYRAAHPSTFAAPAGTASFFIIAGSASKTVKIHKIRISGFRLTTLAVFDVHVKKYSTARVGGTAVALVPTPLDSNFAAATASEVNVFTAAPTDGTLVGTIGSCSRINKSTTVVDGADFADIEFRFGDSPETSAVVLRGTNQYVGVNFGAAPASAVTLTIEVEWTEE